jgi:OOP family OmpA-OmpF porin
MKRINLTMMKKKQLLNMIMTTALLLTAPQSAEAQTPTDPLQSWYFGMGAGIQFSTLYYPDLDNERFPNKKGTTSPIWSLFVQKDFGREGHIAVRPQVSFLKRGGKLTNVGRYSGYADPNLKDVTYSIDARFVDLRLPLLYQFFERESNFRPYIGLTPIVGFVSGGKIRLQRDFVDKSMSGNEEDVSRDNFKSALFSIAPTLGVRFNFHSGKKGQNTIFVNLEASYEAKLTDTNVATESDGEVNRNIVRLDGTRKHSGISLQALVGIPFSAFRRYKEEKRLFAETPIVVIPAAVPEPEPAKPCYTLEEISDLIARGKSVRGKTICAISDLYFESGKSTLQRRSFPYLDRLARIIVSANLSIRVKGHTDNVGSEELNIRLSRQRAVAVMEYLIRKGVDGSKITYSYYGSSMPLSTNDTKEGRALNRRVEFEIGN